jgi:glycosyltransferase involved in cell wall biosynthesis
VSVDLPREPTVSVVIPMYQAGPWIEEALSSVDSQTYPILECIVVDDGSTDDGADVVRAFARTSACEVRLVSQQNAGVSAARNAGLAVTSGDLIALLDADDFWHPSKVAAQLAHLVQEGSSACTTGYALVDSSTRRVTGVVRFGNPERAIRRWLAIEGNGLLLPSTVLFRRAVLDHVIGFDPRVSVCEDLEFATRLLRFGGLTIVPDTLVGYRMHPSQSHRQLDRMASNTSVLLTDVVSFVGFRPSFERRCRANLDIHVGLQMAVSRRFREACTWLLRGVRHRPQSIVSLPVNIVVRRLVRAARVLVARRTWPLEVSLGGGRQ